MKKFNQITTHSAEETMALAENCAGKLVGGEILALHGDLGSGKTTFTKGLAEALKVEEVITSPTFVILKSYPAKINNQKVEFVHIDGYRAETLEDIKSVGIEDFLNRRDVVMIVEWPEKIQEIFTQPVIDIYFKFIDENTREIKMEV
jgi:tRNA threonylcarbamoyladenosine biosynthesis protein TsaE